MDKQPLFDSRGFALAGERVEQTRSPAIFCEDNKQRRSDLFFSYSLHI